jgi:di/tricarboxylate transporter
MQLPPIVQQTIAFAIIAGLFLVMQLRRKTPTDVLFVGALAVAMVCGLISPAEAWQGFSNRAVIAIASLLVVSAALRNSGVLDSVGRVLLANVKGEAAASLRISAALLSLSAFVLNTALVAMVLPVVLNWCRRTGTAASRMLLPISYITILGGTCTLVGTSTNLIVDGELRKTSAEIASLKEREARFGEGDDRLTDQQAWLLKRESDLQPMGLTEISWIGVPCAMIGAAFLIFIGRNWMPRRTEVLDTLGEHRKEYLVEMVVQPQCSLVGKSVEDGGLRSLQGLFLIEIERDGQSITPVDPTDRLMADDRLVFTGVVSTIVELERIPGLIPVTESEVEDQAKGNASKVMVEVVLSPSSPLIGKSIRQANFRQLYNSVVMAVHRNGRRIPRKLGDIQLESGDTLLLQARPSFMETYRNSREFYLVSSVAEAEPRRLDRLYVAGALGLLLIGWLLAIPFLETINVPIALRDPPVVILLIALAMILTRCLPAAQARDSVDWSLLLTVGAAIGIGEAMENSGAAKSLAMSIVGIVGQDPWVLLVTIYVMTVLFTEMLSNAAVAAMMYKIAIDIAQNADANPRTFIFAVTLAASLSFISPIGYQTNLMVMGPGGYRPSDYLRAGAPLSILVGIVALLLLPVLWPF